MRKSVLFYEFLPCIDGFVRICYLFSNNRLRSFVGTKQTGGQKMNLSSCCPICGEPCEHIYLGVDNQVLGCERCVTKIPVYDYALSMNADQQFKGGAVSD